MKISIPHTRNRIEAITHIRKMLNESRSQLAAHVSDVKEEWEGDTLRFSFTAQKSHFEGTLEVRDRSYELYAKLPLTMRLFEGRIEKMIKEQIATQKLA